MMQSSSCAAAILPYAVSALVGLHAAPACAAQIEEAARGSESFRVVAYVAGWAMPAVIHGEKLTHINFAFARIAPDGRAVLADSASEANLARLVALKRTNPRLKVILSIGGWQADGFSDAALTDASRGVLADSAVDLVRRHSLDGVDIDWEYPGQGVAGIRYRAADRQNFTRLLRSLRKKLDLASDGQGRSGGDRYTVTIASADREYFDHTEMDKLHVYLDWINVMSYDFFNSLTATTGHHAGLYPAALASPTDRNADASVKQHLAAGIPAGKLLLGVAFYGRGFAGVRALNNGLNQPYQRYEADHAYAELAERLIDNPDFVRYWDERAKAPYLWNSAARTFITYEDPQSIAIKADYVKSHHLGGIMFWELGQDRDDELLDVIIKSLRR